MKFLNSKLIAEKIQQEVKNQIKKLGRKPGLAVILVGNNPASKLYIDLKRKACFTVGINCKIYKFSSNIQEATIIALTNKLNKDLNVQAILVQLPLPKNLSASKIVQKIRLDKDVDFFQPENLKKISHGSIKILPPVSAGILHLLKTTKQQLTNKNIAIISKSKIFAKPLIDVLQKNKAKITLVNPNSKNLSRVTKKADFIISAVGKKWFITQEMIKKNAVLIDVGCTKIGKKTYGDFNPDVSQKAAYLSPVPGGVGPLTVAYLLKNVLELTKVQRRKR